MLREGCAAVRDVPLTRSTDIRTAAHCHSQRPTLAPLLLALCVACETPTPPRPVRDASPARPVPINPIENVVNPWLWTSARGATDADRAREDIGPYELVPGATGAV